MGWFNKKTKTKQIKNTKILIQTYEQYVKQFNENYENIKENIKFNKIETFLIEDYKKSIEEHIDFLNVNKELLLNLVGGDKTLYAKKIEDELTLLNKHLLWCESQLNVKNQLVQIEGTFQEKTTEKKQDEKNI